MKRVLIVEDRESAGVGCGFLAATLRSLGYEVTEARTPAPGPALPDLRLLVLETTNPRPVGRTNDEEG